MFHSALSAEKMIFELTYSTSVLALELPHVSGDCSDPWASTSYGL